MLNLEDEHGGDEKLICVPVDTTFPYYSDVGERQDLPSIVLQQIEHFFTHYKDLEAEKWVRVGNWGDAEDARRVLLEAIERAKAKVERRLTATSATFCYGAPVTEEAASWQDQDRIYFAQRAAEEQELRGSRQRPRGRRSASQAAARLSRTGERRRPAEPHRPRSTG